MRLISSPEEALELRLRCDREEALAGAPLATLHRRIEAFLSALGFYGYTSDDPRSSACGLEDALCLCRTERSFCLCREKWSPEPGCDWSYLLLKDWGDEDLPVYTLGRVRRVPLDEPEEVANGLFADSACVTDEILLTNDRHLALLGAALDDLSRRERVSREFLAEQMTRARLMPELCVRDLLDGAFFWESDRQREEAARSCTPRAAVAQALAAEVRSRDRQEVLALAPLAPLHRRIEASLEAREIRFLSAQLPGTVLLRGGSALSSRLHEQRFTFPPHWPCWGSRDLFVLRRAWSDGPFCTYTLGHITRPEVCGDREPDPDDLPFRTVFRGNDPYLALLAALAEVHAGADREDGRRAQARLLTERRLLPAVCQEGLLAGAFFWESAEQQDQAVRAVFAGLAEKGL